MHSYGVYKWNVKDSVLARNGFFLDGTYLEDVKLIDYTEVKEDDNTYLLYYNLILLTDDTAIYELQLEFLSDAQGTPKPVLNWGV